MQELFPPPWQPDTDDTLVCTAIRPETHDVKTFVFAPLAPRLFRFQAGQFMTFDLAEAGVQRCYTIASPPTRPWRIEITVKRPSTGPGAGWLHTHMRPGMRIKASGPMGDFTLSPEGAGRLLLLSAGSGITPLMSMARTLHDLGSPADTLFVQSARSPADLLFRHELAAMTARPGFRAVSIVGTDAPGRRWDGFRGRLNPAMLAMLAPDLHQRTVYCCGPAPYMTAVRAMLDAVGFDRARYHEESFDFGAATEPAVAEITPDASSFSIRFAKTGQTVPCPAGTTVLAAGRAAGIRLPSACGKGVCGTCKSRLLSGSVAMRHGGGIRQREIDDGFALLCCARPASDLVVDR